AFIVVIYNDRNRNVILRSPTDQTVVNSQYLADGTLDPARLTPRNAGFGAATGAQPLRNLQLQIRLGFLSRASSVGSRLCAAWPAKAGHYQSASTNISAVSGFSLTSNGHHDPGLAFATC